MIALPISIAALGFLFTLICPNRLVSQTTIFTVVALAILVPSNAPTRDVLVTAAIGALATLIVAVMRMPLALGKAVPNVWLLGFLAYSSMVMALNFGGAYGWYVILTNLVYLVVVAFVSRSEKNGTAAFFAVVPIFIVVEFLLTSGEEFFGLKALWPQTTGTDNITSRVNTIAPWLAGRAMGSTSHPIPLGILMGILCALCIWIAVSHIRSYWVFVAPASLVLLLSGTRSSFLALFLSLFYWFVSRAGSKRLPVFILAGVLGLVILLSTDVGSLLGLSDVSLTDSYTHRADVLSFIPELAGRPLTELIFGSGYKSIGTLLQSSSFADGSGILVFDEEYVRTTVATGLVGLLLMGMSLVEGFKRGNIPSRMILVFLCVSFLSFDALSWNMTTLLFVVACSGPIMNIPPVLQAFQPKLRYPSIPAANRWPISGTRPTRAY